MKRAAAIAALLASGCSSTSSGGEAAAPAAPDKPRTNPVLAHRAMHYLNVNFQGTTWLEDVKRIKVRDGEMYVKTDLYPDSDADEPTKSICTALRFLPSTPHVVHVVSTTGEWTGC